VDKVSVTVDSVAGIVEDVKGGKGTVGRLFTDDTIAVKLEKVLTDLDEGAVGQLLRDEVLRDDVVTVMANLRKVSAMLTDGEGTAAMLLKDPRLYEKLMAVIDDVERITSSLSPDRGMLRVLRDEKTADSLMNTVASVEQVTADIKEIVGDVKAGKGTLGLLLTDEEMPRKIQTAVSRLDDFLEEQRENTTFLTFATLLLGAF
jgi:hypothetical protein